MSDIANDLDWSEIFSVYHPKIFSYIYRRTSDPMLSDDLASAAFVRAIEANNAGKGSKTHFSGWIYRIAHNLIIDHYRARDHFSDTVELDAEVPNQTEGQTTTYGEIITSTKPDPHDLAVQTIAVECVRAAVSQLVDKQMQAITMRLEGYDNADIADITGNTEQGVRGLNTRAFVNLRLRLEAV